MAPHFECANFHSRNKNSDGVTKSLDEAASIGESFGLNPGQVLQVYNASKTEQQENVLEQASEIASSREGLVPRISGKPPQPNAEEEQQAWDALYAERCSS